MKPFDISILLLQCSLFSRASRSFFSSHSVATCGVSVRFNVCGSGSFKGCKLFLITFKEVSRDRLGSLKGSPGGQEE